MNSSTEDSRGPFRGLAFAARGTPGLVCLLLLGAPGCAADAARAMQNSADGQAPIVQRALDDAARRTGLPASQLKVIATDEVTWTDSSLGCPTPGASYTMALVPGYRVVIQAGGARLQYHASRGGNVIYCPPGRAQEPRRDERM